LGEVVVWVVDVKARSTISCRYKSEQWTWVVCGAGTVENNPSYPSYFSTAHLG
jgi:hypothetical protein